MGVILVVSWKRLDELSIEAPLTKLEQVARLVSVPPTSMQPRVSSSALFIRALIVDTSMQEYLSFVIPPLFDILAPPAPTQVSPPSHKRAAAFTLSRILNKYPHLATPLIHLTLHAPFSSPESRSSSISQSLAIVTTFFTNSDPSPTLLTSLLEPLIPPFYFLLLFLDQNPKIILSDPGIKEVVKGLMRSWARVGDKGDVAAGLWDVLKGVQGWGMQRHYGREGIEEIKRWAVEQGRLVIRFETYACSSLLLLPE